MDIYHLFSHTADNRIIEPLEFFHVESWIVDERLRIIEQALCLRPHTLHASLVDGTLRDHWNACRAVMSFGTGYVQIRAIRDDLEASLKDLGARIQREYDHVPIADHAEVLAAWTFAIDDTQQAFLHQCLSLAVVRTMLRAQAAYWDVPYAPSLDPTPNQALMWALFKALKDTELRAVLDSKKAICLEIERAGDSLRLIGTSRDYARKSVTDEVKARYNVTLPDRMSSVEGLSEKRRPDSQPWTLADEWWERLQAGMKAKAHEKQERRDANVREAMSAFREAAKAPPDA